MNLKKYYKDLLTASSELVAKVGNNGILSAYPQEVTRFPCVIYEDSNSSDTEFSDNYADGLSASVRIHIFTKTIKNYPTTNEIGELVHSVFKLNHWTMTMNQETADVQDNIRHRIMDFSRKFFFSVEI
jgi:hypothetical protein